MDENNRKKIMVAIDDSECSHYALTWALENLNDTVRKSQLVVFTAQSIINPNYAFASAYMSAPRELLASVQERNSNIALALLDKAKEICSDHGIEAEIINEIGDPKLKICDAVEKHDIQLLVLGSHGRGTIKRIVLGSVSNYCTHNAKCPVLIVKKPV